MREAEAALAVLEEGIQRAERTNERMSLAELLRLRAAARLALERADRPAAEACLGRALAVARAQQARWWELRAAPPSPASGPRPASAPRRTTSWPRFTAGSPKASTPPT
jgi:hypothetical protein